jgi:hypothetical protein
VTVGEVAAPERRSEVVELCGPFVEKMVSEGLEVATRTRKESGEIAIDWDSVWSAGDEAGSIDAAVGMVILAAYESLRSLGVGDGVLIGLDGAGSSVEPSQELHAVDAGLPAGLEDLPFVILPEEVQGQELFTWEPSVWRPIKSSSRKRSIRRPK